MTVPYQDLIGKPFAWGARGPEAFDCWGLVRFALARAGQVVPDYPSNTMGKENAVTMLKAMTEAHWLRAKDVQIGDVVTFRMNERFPTHVGLMIEPDRFLHILVDTHVVTERLSSPLWIRRQMGFYRYLEPEWA